jgi:DNA-directed RNA polymerase specialized sigma24 family protein
MKRRFSDYDDYLEIFNYSDEKEMRNVLRNIPRLQELAESTKGVSNATVILADISKAMTCLVDEYDCVSSKQFEAIYYAFFCGFPYSLAAEEMKCKWWTVRREANEAIKKLVYILGEGNGKESQSERTRKNGKQAVAG